MELNNRLNRLTQAIRDNRDTSILFGSVIFALIFDFLGIVDVVDLSQEFNEWVDRLSPTIQLGRNGLFIDWPFYLPTGECRLANSSMQDIETRALTCLGSAENLLTSIR